MALFDKPSAGAKVPPMPGMHAYTSKEAPLLPKNAQVIPSYNVHRIPKSFRITLHSSDRLPGSTLTAAQFNIPIPSQFTSARMHLSIDTFIVSTTPNPIANLDRHAYQISIRELNNTSSFDSRTGGPSGILASLTSRAFATPVQREVGAALVTDPAFFERPLTVEITSPHFDTAAADGIANPWSLSLVLYDAGSSEPQPVLGGTGRL